MLELIEIFFIFFKIGLFSFGGGYGMLPLMQQEAVTINGWLTESEFLSFLAIAESTPGPIAINMATFIGSSKYGILGSIFATLGVVMPSFIIILLIVAVFKNFLKSKIVKSALAGMKPMIAGLIFATGIFLGVKNFLPNIRTFSVSGFSLAGLILTIALAIFYFSFKKIFKKKLSPIVLIIISAVLGIIIF